ASHAPLSVAAHRAAAGSGRRRPHAARSLLMPTLRVTRGGGAPTLHRIYKTTTSIGRGEENDVSLPDDRELSDAHAVIEFDGREFSVAPVDRGADVAVNGKKRSRQRLGHQDTMRAGTTDFVFSIFDEATGATEVDRASDALSAYRSLHEFS